MRRVQGQHRPQTTTSTLYSLTAWQLNLLLQPLPPTWHFLIRPPQLSQLSSPSLPPRCPLARHNPSIKYHLRVSTTFIILTSNLSLSLSRLKTLTPTMGSIYRFATPFLPLVLFFFVSTMVEPSFGALVKQQPLVLKYHNGALLKGKVTVNLIWYGRFTPIQRSIIVDFIQSLSSSPKILLPSAASWWRTTEKYKGGSATVVVGRQILNENYSMGKNLKNPQIVALASTAGHLNSVNVVLTAKDVTVDGFCMSRCGTHGSTRGKTRFAYAWVGNSETQCPGQCAWPFHQPIYGPQTPPLVAPNGDVGVDGMVINLATVLAGTVTNPFNNGYFQGPATAPLEAVSACTGVFGSGAYPGYAGQVLVDKTTGASYNAHGVNGRKYLLPAMWDPQTSACSTLI